MHSPAGASSSPRGFPMTSPSLPHEDLGLRLTPTEQYRCPVSTPANFVARGGRPRRTRPLQEDIYSQTNNSHSDAHSQRSLQRSHPGPTIQKPSKRPGPRAGWAPKMTQALDYYWVDKGVDSQEAAVTNTHWLRSLVSQPVDEILNKYRRKTDLKRTQNIWLKTFTTPGEKRLLTAWKSNSVSGRGYTPQSANVGGVRTRASAGSLRMTRSEPPPSRTQFDSRAITPSACTPRRNVTGPTVLSPSPCLSPELIPEPNHSSAVVRKVDSSKCGSQSLNNIKNINGSLLDATGEADSRISTYTTKYIKKVDGFGKEKIYAKVTFGPEQLYTVPTGRKVASMLYNTQLSKSHTALPKISSGSCDENTESTMPETVEQKSLLTGVQDEGNAYEPVEHESSQVRQRL